MEKIRNLLGAAAIAVSELTFGASAKAQVAPLPTATITIDENGFGLVEQQPPFGNFYLSAFSGDPGPGGLPSSLRYLFQAYETVGDVLLVEPDGSLSDLIRFGDFGIVFYSDDADGADSLADVGFPTEFYTNSVTLPEVGIGELLNGAVYTPTQGQPGYTNNVVVTYRFISDGSAVPEPATWTMMLLGFAAVGLLVRQARRANGPAPLAP